MKQFSFQEKKQQNKAINRTIKYHDLICKLHKKIESICSGTMLVQLFFLVISVGSPLFQILFVRTSLAWILIILVDFSIFMFSFSFQADLSTMPVQKTSFLVSYVAWSTSQLAVYCLLSDNATNAVRIHIKSRSCCSTQKMNTFFRKFYSTWLWTRFGIWRAKSALYCLLHSKLESVFTVFQSI